jgi:hypothetical protein
MSWDGLGMCTGPVPRDETNDKQIILYFKYYLFDLDRNEHVYKKKT